MATARAEIDTLTPTQRRAVDARGNVLVMAGAGTGKTKTLVERCLDCLKHGAAIDELLVVTFTEAAAAEMRARLRQAMEAEAARERIGTSKDPGNGRAADLASPTRFWSEQLARFDLAHIGTLHSFCFKLVREHFYELGLDPRPSLLDEGQARQLAQETLDEQFAPHYAGQDEFSLAVQNVIQTHGGGRDDAIRELVLKVHHYAQTLPDAAGWLAGQRQKFSEATPGDWRRWLPEAMEDWRRDWLPLLRDLPANEKAVELADRLERLPSPAVDLSWRQAASGVLAEIVAADNSWPAKRKLVLRKPIEALFAEAQFLHSLTGGKPGEDPLAEDWTWVRGQMETQLRLAEEFAGRLAERKRAGAVLDFHDLEQFALRLLWDLASGRPTAVAAGWRAKLKFVFVDEYQDINAAQDKIIQGVSREGAEANRFLVGDVKQSIYRFRLADPAIFRHYARQWSAPAGATIPLRENFRSREGLLNLTNSLFGLLMREETGGVAYEAEAELQFGARETRGDLSAANDPAPRAELLLRLKPGRRGPGERHADESAELDDTQREARLVARRVQQLVADRHPIFDGGRNEFRPAQWGDIAILLRSPRGRAEVYAKEFERAGVPLAVAAGGFYRSAEILDLLCLLQLLDNPLQDVPCLAVLRSPLVGLSLDEMAEIRLAAPDQHFWTALQRAGELGVGQAETKAKISRFRGRFSRWRRLARLVSLSQCLEEVLAETLYGEWLRTQPRGPQRAANVAGFLHLARQYDQFQRQGLFRFLKFIEAQQETETEPEAPAAAAENAVRLLSIHQSKGLEFPVVVVADLAKKFNERDLHGEIIFDEHYGLCPKVKPPQSNQRYPSLPHWLAQRRQKRELRGEELRLLYVALTRARDHLILTASVTAKSWEEKWTQPQPATPRTIAAAQSFADWLALWFARQGPAGAAADSSTAEGELPGLRWRLAPDEEDGPGGVHPGERAAQSTAIENKADTPPEEGAAGLDKLRARLEWRYPFQAATERKAKASVTALRRAAEAAKDEAQELFAQPVERPRTRRVARKSKLSAAEIGAAHHKFLEHFALDNSADWAAEADRLTREARLTSDERAALDLAALANFWESPLGRQIRAQPETVRRELPFTARFSPRELATLTGIPAGVGLEDEFVVVQGVADLVVVRREELWLVDFKTDDVSPHELPEKIKTYSPQVRLYASALEKIFRRQVTLRALHFLTAGRTEEI